MGLLSQLRDKRVYLDTNVFIYLLEGTSEYQSVMKEVLRGLEEVAFEAHTSTLTLTEILPPLVRSGDEGLLSSTIEFIRDSGSFRLIDIDDEVGIQAGFLRGETKMKTPDALHVACAVEAHCDVFLTNDAGIRVPQGMTRLLVSEFL